MITKNYIKMCEKAKEIQKGHKFVEGDWFYFKNDDIGLGAEYNCAYPCILSNNSDTDAGVIEDLNRRNKRSREYIEIKDEGIWLPTQEQLQEMVKDWLFYITGSFTDIYASASTGTRDSHVVCNKAKSMNELWLIFVMKEKYNKIWNGKEWIKG